MEPLYPGVTENKEIKRFIVQLKFVANAESLYHALEGCPICFPPARVVGQSLCTNLSPVHTKKWPQKD